MSMNNTTTNNDNTTNNNTVVIPQGGPQDYDDVKKMKQGHSFLFCLCDMRITVITLDVLSFIGSIITLILLIVLEKTMSQDTINDLYHENEHSIVKKVYYFQGSLVSIIVIEVIAMLVHLGGVIGASKFYMCPIILEIVWNAVYVLLMLLSHKWIAVLVSLFFLYPRTMLCYELGKGIMTRDNYKSQERKCCCSC